MRLMNPDEPYTDESGVRSSIGFLINMCVVAKFEADPGDEGGLRPRREAARRFGQQIIVLSAIRIEEEFARSNNVSRLLTLSRHFTSLPLSDRKVDLAANDFRRHM